MNRQIALATAAAVFFANAVPVDIGGVHLMGPNPALAAVQSVKAPGLFGLNGAAEVAARLLAKPNQISAVLVQQAKNNKVKEKDLDAYMNDQWAQIGKDPAGSRIFNIIMFLELERAISTNSGDPADKKFVAAFREYGRQLNVYMAETALDKYYTWKANPKNNRPGSVGLGVLFDFGDVPIDFQAEVSAQVVGASASAAMLAAGAALGAAAAAHAAATAGAAAAAYSSAVGIQATLAGTAAASTTAAAGGLSASVLAAGAGGVGLVILGTAASAVLSFDRIVKIASAEGTLKKAVEDAKKGENALGKTMKERLGYWSLATQDDFKTNVMLRGSPVLTQASTVQQSMALVGWRNVDDYKCDPKRIGPTGVPMGVTCKSKKDGKVVESGPTVLADGSMIVGQAPPKVEMTVAPPAVYSEKMKIMCSGSLCPPALSWKSVQGVADDVGVGKDGSVWVVSTNDLIYRWVNGVWKQIPGQGVHIAVAPDGNAWLVNRAGLIYRYDGTKWVQVPGTGQDVGVGADGTVWITGHNDYIYRRDGNAWRQIGGQGVRIAVAPDGNPWLVNRAGKIFRYDGKKWLDMPGEATDIGVGPDGKVWIVNKYGTFSWETLLNFGGGPSGTWMREPGVSGTVIAGAPSGGAWVIDKARKIYALK